MLCPGSQNDISVYGDLLFLSTDSSRNNDSCTSTAQPATVKESWEGIKIFDISDKTNPRYVKSVETNCGSHTHTLVPGKDRRSVYVYVSSYFPNATFPDCQPPHDLISIIKVPLQDADGRGRRGDAEPLPGRRQPAGQRHAARPPAATTSPRTRPRTSPPARAWVTASCSTSPGRRRPG